MKNVPEKNNKDGSGMIHLKPRQTGFVITNKRVERIYREERSTTKYSAPQEEDLRDQQGTQPNPSGS